MKNLKYFVILLFIVTVSLSFTRCKTQNINNKVPFTITEKTYFYWVGGKKGTNGTNIKIVGTYISMNVSFSNFYFQNHEYKLGTQLNDDGFILTGTFSEFRKRDLIMHQNPEQENSNEVPKIEKKIPFDLKNDEAILEYTVNGKIFYHKLTSVKQLDTVYYP